MDENTKWKCKYHVVFAPKFRRKEIYGKILRDLCKRKEAEIHEAYLCKESCTYANQYIAKDECIKF